MRPLGTPRLHPSAIRWARCGLLRMAPAALGVLAFAAPGASANPPRPLDLRVDDGGSWQANRSFSVSWNAPPASTPVLIGTHYRVRDLNGGTTQNGFLARTEDGIGSLVVPPVPGSYTAEVWFEDASGAEGPAATVSLRFDNTRPASVEPEALPPWVGRSSFPLRVSLSHPSGPLPISGIRGYAVALDANPTGAPCAPVDRCSVTETTLQSGIGGDELWIPALPEGNTFVHAAAVSASGMRSLAVGHAELHVDLTDPVTGLSGGRGSWTNRPVALVAESTDARSGMSPTGHAPAPFTAIRIDDGTPAIAPGPRIEAGVIGEGVHRVAYYARDAAGNVDDGAVVNGTANTPPRIAVVRIDRTPPLLFFANSQDPRDPGLLRASLADGLSGPEPARGWIGVRPAGSGERFGRLPTWPGPAGELRAHWDSDSYPVGRYEFQATGYDAAGNAGTAARRRDGAPMILSNPLKAGTELKASFAGDRLRCTVSYGRGVRVSGRLTTGIRSPLAGMAVRIVERFAAGARPATRTSTVTTGRDGTYSLRLEPGSSREVTASFGGDPRLGRAASATLELAVRSTVRLRASSRIAEVGGAPLVFRGAVSPSESAPIADLPVQLQFRLAGAEWSEFRTVKTNRRGRFRYAYRFSDDDSRGARFQFRAYVPTHENWPYEPSSSRPVLVKGY